MGLLSGLLELFGRNKNISEKKGAQKDTAEIQSLNPNAILFATPTLNNSLPVFEEKTDTCVLFHEDDWRQIEFVSKSQRIAIETEISKIKDILDNHSHKGNDYIAYKKVAVRDLITEPLSIDFSTLLSYLTNEPIEVQHLGLDNNPGQIKGGFFFTLKGVNYYGVVDSNVAKAFCIYSTDSEEDFKESANNFARLLAVENLYLVDWRAAHVFDETNMTTDFMS